MGTFKKYKIDEELYKGHKGEYIVTRRLTMDFRDTLYIERVPNDKKMQEQGIDALGYKLDEFGRIPDNYSHTLEIKTDFSKYKSLFVEEHSDFDSGKKEIGYLWGSQADYLCYYFAYQHKLYILNFEDFRAYMTQNLNSKNPYKLMHKRKPEKTETTYYYIVPLEDIRQYLFEMDIEDDFDHVNYDPKFHDNAGIRYLNRRIYEQNAYVKMINAGIEGIRFDDKTSKILSSK